MKKWTALLLALCLMLSLACASAATLTPNAAPSGINRQGTLQYYMSVLDDTQIETGGFLTLGLYVPEVFSANTVRKLKAGDTAVLNGEKLRVLSMLPVEGQEGWLEMVPAEGDHSYICFVPAGGGSTYIAIIDDWAACTFVSELKVWMPLPDKFVYACEEEEKQYTAGEFIRLLQNGAGAWINQYNTIVTLENGTPVRIDHSDYPEGPQN